MVDDFGSSFGLETLFPGRDERRGGDDLAGCIYRTDIFEDLIGD